MTRGRRKARRMRHALPPAPPLPAEPEPSPSYMNTATHGLLHDDAPTYPRKLTTEELTGGKDDTALTADLAAALRRIPTCTHCGGRHTRACPRVKRMQFHPNGALASVEFWAEGKWNDSEIIWQEDIAEAEE